MPRVGIALMLPLAASVIAGLIIISIGTLLLEIAEDFSEMVAVAVALAIAGAILLGCALAAPGRPQEPRTHHPAGHWRQGAIRAVSQWLTARIRVLLGRGTRRGVGLLRVELGDRARVL